MYRHPCIVYLQGMKAMGVFAWTLVSLVACSKSLHGQSSVTHDPQTTVASGTHEDLVIFKLLTQI